METIRLNLNRTIKTRLQFKRGTIAIGAIAIILMFIIAISCFTAIVLEYNSYSKQIANTTQTDAMKAKENLLIQTNRSSENLIVTATNEGSTPSTIIAVLTLNPSDNTLTYHNLDQPLTCTILGENTFSINQQPPQDWPIGVLTTFGNVFWKTQTQQTSSPTLTSTPTPTSTPASQLWLTGWQHRKSHTINPAAGTGTNYQIKIAICYGIGTDNTATAYLNDHCRTDFADIRFTDSDGITQLSYWIENVVDSNYAVFWVKIADDLSTNPATIYLYYGNPTATTTSNGAATFLMFQDVVTDVQTQFGTSPLTTYTNARDPGDGFLSSSPIDDVYASPCLWFRYYGGKQYQVTSTCLYFYGYLNAGNYGTCGIDIRFRNNPAPTGWQPSNSYGADATVNRKHIVILDYSVIGGARLNFYSTWQSNNDDYSAGTIVSTYSLAATARSVQAFTYSGDISHTTIGYQSNGNSITLYHTYYAIAKHVNTEPTHSTWGPEIQP